MSANGTSAASRRRSPREAAPVRRRVAKYQAKIARASAARPYFLHATARYEHDARAVLAALHKWLRNRKYAPTAPDLVRWRGYNEPALRRYLADLEANGMVTATHDHRWLLTAAGSTHLGREHVLPILPGSQSERKKLLARIRRRADDDREVAAVRAALGAPDNETLYRRLQRTAS